MGPLPSLFTPLLTLLFLIQLSRIIRDYLQQSLATEIKNLLTQSDKMLKALRDDIESGELLFDPLVHDELRKLETTINESRDEEGIEKLKQAGRTIKAAVAEIHQLHLVEPGSEMESQKRAQLSQRLGPVELSVARIQVL